MTARKYGLRIEMKGTPAFGGFPGVAPEMAVTCRPTKINLPLPGPDWHIVKFATGGKLCVHGSAFRVIDNRASAVGEASQ